MTSTDAKKSKDDKYKHQIKNTWCIPYLARHLNELNFNITGHFECRYGDTCRQAHSKSEIVEMDHVKAWRNRDKSNVDLFAIKKNIIPINTGEIKLPKNIPNLNQALLRGKRNLELISPKIKNINEIINDQIRILLFCNIGHKEIIKNIIANTIPKLLLELILILLLSFINKFIYFCCHSIITFFIKMINLTKW